jgi:pimeloyl-ACP methyl ester carboxylesterase
MAHRYPEDVKGLILSGPPTGNIGELKKLADGHYFKFADLAENDGMSAVATASGGYWAPDFVYQTEANKQRLLSMDASEFSTIMRRWGRWMVSERFFLAGLSDEMLRQIVVPAMITTGLDTIHAETSGEGLRSRLPNAQLVEYSAEERKRISEADSATQSLAPRLHYYEEFLRRESQN